MRKLSQKVRFIDKTLSPKTTDKNVKKPSLRTDRQNRALHLYLSMLAEELNDGGFSVKLVLAEKMDLDWDSRLVKELLWRPAQKAITGKKSTTKLNKAEEITKIYDHLTRHLGEKFGVFVEFPHFEDGEYEKHTASVGVDNEKQ